MFWGPFRRNWLDWKNGSFVNGFKKIIHVTHIFIYLILFRGTDIPESNRHNELMNEITNDYSNCFLCVRVPENRCQTAYKLCQILLIDAQHHPCPSKFSLVWNISQTVASSLPMWTPPIRSTGENFKRRKRRRNHSSQQQ